MDRYSYELERAGYDNWRTREGCIYNRRNSIGYCSCGEKIYENMLWVEKNDEIYHLSCYNEMRLEESEDVEEDE